MIILNLTVIGYSSRSSKNELTDINFESNLVFKYKKPAIAFDSIETDKNEFIIFSLHANKTAVRGVF